MWRQIVRGLASRTRKETGKICGVDGKNERKSCTSTVPGAAQPQSSLHCKLVCGEDQIRPQLSPFFVADSCYFSGRRLAAKSAMRWAAGGSRLARAAMT